MNSKEYWNKVAKDKSFSTPFQMDIFKEYVDKDASYYNKQNVFLPQEKINSYYTKAINEILK